MKNTLLIAVLIALSGCSAKPLVREITELSGDKVAGIPFRIAADHVVEIWQLKDDEDDYTIVAVAQQRMADSSRLFSMNYEGGPFGSRFLKVVQNADNTLKSVQITSTDTTSQTLDSLSSTLTGFTTADAAKKTAALAGAKSMVEADKAVRDAQKDLDALPATTSAETRAIYERILDSAKQQAAAARASVGQY